MKSYILNCFAIVLLLECSCVYTATIKPQTATHSGCDGVAINMCLRNISTTVAYSIISVLQDVDTKLAPFCRLYGEAKSCMLPLMETCSGTESLGFRSIIYGFDYVCSDKGTSSISDNQSCFTSVEIVNGMKQCSANVTNADMSHACSIPRHFISCSLNLTNMYCDLGATRAMAELMTSVFQAYTDEFNCVYSLPEEVNNTTPAAHTTPTPPISPFVTFEPTDCPAMLQTCLALLSNFSIDRGLDVFCGTFKEIIGCMNKTVDQCKAILPHVVDIRDNLITSTQQLKSICVNSSTSSSLVTPLPIPVSHPPTGCSIGSLGQCLRGLSPILPWQQGPQGSQGNIDLTAACRSFVSVGDCYRKASASCPPTQTLQFDILVAMYEYICTPTGQQNFLSLITCFKIPDAVKAMGNCSDLSNLNQSDSCSVPNHFITCSVNVAKRYCAPATLPAINEIISSAFQPYSKVFNCDLSQGNQDSGNGGMSVFTASGTLLSLLLLLFVSNM